MGTINVLLAGGLKLNGCGRGRMAAADGTFPLALEEGSTVCNAIQSMGVPFSEVAITLLNGCRCGVLTSLHSGDRLVLAAKDVAALWRFLCRQNLGTRLGFAS
jgi:hypothetical protein